MTVDDYITKPDPITRIWRYISYSKFESLINTSTLFFAQAKRFDDPYEGSMRLVDLGVIAGTDLESKLETLYHAPNGLRAYTAVNCWHMNEYESLAMWKLYIRDNRGVAIQTTVERLNLSLINIESCGPYRSGAVSYITKLPNPPPGPDGYSAELVFFAKRPEYSHEREYRIIVLARDLKLINREGGLRIPVDLNILIESVYLAPGEPTWKKTLIEEALQSRIESNIPVYSSSLDMRPPY